MQFDDVDQVKSALQIGIAEKPFIILTLQNGRANMLNPIFELVYVLIRFLYCTMHEGVKGSPF